LIEVKQAQLTKRLNKHKNLAIVNRSHVSCAAHTVCRGHQQ